MSLKVWWQSTAVNLVTFPTTQETPGTVSVGAGLEMKYAVKVGGLANFWNFQSELSYL